MGDFKSLGAVLILVGIGVVFTIYLQTDKELQVNRDTRELEGLVGSQTHRKEVVGAEIAKLEARLATSEARVAQQQSRSEELSRVESEAASLRAKAGSLVGELRAQVDGLRSELARLRAEFPRLDLGDYTTGKGQRLEGASVRALGPDFVSVQFAGGARRLGPEDLTESERTRFLLDLTPMMSQAEKAVLDLEADPLGDKELAAEGKAKPVAKQEGKPPPQIASPPPPTPGAAQSPGNEETAKLQTQIEELQAKITAGQAQVLAFGGRAQTLRLEATRLQMEDANAKASGRIAMGHQGQIRDLAKQAADADLRRTELELAVRRWEEMKRLLEMRLAPSGAR